MKLHRMAGSLGVLLLAASAVWGQGSLLPVPDDRPIRAARMPALSPDGKRLCFSYMGDLWTVPSTGGTATRLTVHEAHDAYPRWSPDGRWIAFSSNRDGATYDLYIVPAKGGEPRQLTFHSATDIVNDWSPDGRKILFYSGRGIRGFEECELDLQTGVTKTLTHLETTLRYASYAPDGRSIAYTRMRGPIPFWRPRYRGSGNAEIYVFTPATGATTRLTHYDGMDMWPLFGPDGRTVYYVTDAANGTPNLVRQPVAGGRITPVTRHTGDAVRFPAIARDGSLLAYEYSGGLWTVDPSGGTPSELRIYARSEAKANAIQRLTLTSGATEVEVSGDGKQLALALRGEIWTVPSDKGGDAKRVTENPAHDYDFTWAPEGTRLAFISDRNGPYNLYVLDTKTPTTEKRLTAGAYDDSSPHWSPDGKTLAFLRSGPDGGLYTIPAEGGRATRVAEAPGHNLTGSAINSFAWSPDGRWLAFSRRDALETRDIWIVPGAGGEAINVTRYPGFNGMPRWTGDGKWLLFLSSRGDGSGRNLYALPLEKPKDEEEEGETRGRGGGEGTRERGSEGATKGADEKKPGEEKKPDAKPKTVEVKIDFDDIHLREKALTTGADPVGGFAVLPDNKTVVFARGGDYWSMPIAGGNATRLATTGDARGEPRTSPDGSKLYYLSQTGTVRTLVRPNGTPGSVSYTARMELDRRAELAEAFNQFWRHLNTGFYDTKMHGADWRAVRARYEPLLGDIAAPEDFALLLSYMVGELNASHSEVSPAQRPESVTTASLGMEFDEAYGGPGLKVTKVMPRGPADREPHKIAVGEYLLAVDGTDVRYHEAFYKTLQDKAGRSVELVVNSKPSKEGARTVKLKPITAVELADLDYERRVKEARQKVDQLSRGRLAYIHIRGMNPPSLQRFERELYGDAQLKEGLVLDIRNNGGGNTHDNLLGPLSRVIYAHMQPRDALRSTQPVRHWNKPIVLLINQDSASDAEIFPYGFRALKLGKILGMPTPGYVIGTYDGQLVDGTRYRIPTVGWFTKEGKNLENNGVLPDIEVENDPEELAKGRDPQLEAAIKEALKDLGR